MVAVNFLNIFEFSRVNKIGGPAYRSCDRGARHNFLLTDSEHPGYLTVKLFSKNSHLCNYNPPMSQRDRRTDGRHTVAVAR